MHAYEHEGGEKTKRCTLSSFGCVVSLKEYVSHWIHPMCALDGAHMGKQSVSIIKALTLQC